MYGHRLIRELLGLLFLFCGLLMLLSLWSYDVSDPTFNQAVSIKVSSIHNSAGLFGAYLAGFFADTFGIGSYLWIVFFLAVGACLISRWIVLLWYRWIGYTLLFCCMLTFSSVMDIQIHGIRGGGLLGQWLCAFSYLFFSPSGSLLVWFFIFLVAVELSFRISWLSLFSGCLEWISKKFPSWESLKKISLLSSNVVLIKRFFPIQIPWRHTSDTEKMKPTLDIVAFSVSSEHQKESVPLVLKESGEQFDKQNQPAEDFLILEETNSEEIVSSQDLSLSLISESKKEEQPEFLLELEEKQEKTENKEDTPLILNSVSSDTLNGSMAGEEESVLLEQSEQNFQDSSVSDENKQNHVTSEAIAEGIQYIGSLGYSFPTIPSVSSTPASEPSPFAVVRKTDVSSFADNTEISQIESAHGDAEYDSVAAAVAKVMSAQQEIADASVSCKDSGAGEPICKKLNLPSFELLEPIPVESVQNKPDEQKLKIQGEALITCLKNFNVHATLADIKPGPVVTMFEVRPAPGVKATRITNLANDLAMSLKAVSVRMQAPVPGTDTVGVEVPNDHRATVHFREIVENDTFRQARSLLTIALGKDTGGHPVSADLAKMPHLLVAGATGAGKSVCLNAIILSLLYRARPDEVQLILVDPKRVELSMYADLPHLVHPVITDMDLTKNALLWAIDEMNRRLSLFSKVKVRNITGYNDRQSELRKRVEEGFPAPVDSETGEPEDLSPMPFLVIIVDELADLMMVKRKEVEGSIVRLAQLARAAGIHLIIATQRPSVDVVTGLIKANFPCRIAFKVTSGQDSRTILDGTGAEKLLGNGDMLFKPNGGAVQRLHGAFVSDKEVAAIVEYWKSQQSPNYKIDFAEFGNEEQEDSSDDFGQTVQRSNDIVDDPIYAEAIQFVLDNGKVSISLLQRRFRIGFNRAARFVEQMEKDGILSHADGTRPRSVVHR